ncbi:MAG TPA: ATP-dependent RNA helicase HrpA [Dermatophilaceae bacterium]|nr:ATP-dependent RNA helicase HrpA [Dermatophilaceae bacterium]
MPVIAYPPDLPVVARKDDIAAAIRDHQVVVVAGETGSGKTTQLPKICLELGRGQNAMIGHTQPRRIAARSVAERVAEELGSELGDLVGYQVRFTERAGAATRVKVMTDGILLAELQRDRDLRRYDTLIVDEAHERSLNIDFVLGYLKQLLPRRPDLRVVITSATIDPRRFAEHFVDAAGRPAPVIEVSGRTYPVQVRYRPLVRDAGDQLVDIDQVTGVCEAVEELWTEQVYDTGGTDILVFLSGEREIRDTADALAAMSLPGTEILPLYARLSAAEQHRVFARHGGRRVVLATNVAETSLTVPGIRYVVDAGTARISRYSQRTKVQRLPIEPISQASARQRAGRCGRLADGVCIRLYSEEDHDARSVFTDPEVLRTNLASVILQMTSLRLGDVAAFPFLDPPDSRQITDGVRVLEELQAIERGRLTAYGKQLAQLPVDPRLARMLVEAHANGALREVLVIVAALSIQDPRERPADKQAQADQSHARFRDEHSDFVALLNLWAYLKERQSELSGSAFRRMCKAEYLHYLRVREWQDLVAQLRRAAKSAGLHQQSGEATPTAVHQSLLVGLLSQVGLRDPAKRDYLGARGARFAISPGSALSRKQPDWVMAAELIETTRLWARTVARTDPAWVERAAQHLVKRSYSEPHWERKRASAVALERVTLYGVPLVAGRKVGYGRIDPQTSRDLFIRHALVEGDWETHHEFFHANRALLQDLSELEHRARRRDILADEETLVEFYDRRLPETVVSGANFDVWWKRARRGQPDLLTLTADVLVAGDAELVQAQDYPLAWEQDGLQLPVSYQFEPGSAADGVTVHVPVAVLNRLQDKGFDWQVPGLRQELAVALVRSLPKAIRVRLVPIPDQARAALAATGPAAGTITDELARALRARTGVVVDPDQWDWERVPDHLRITFAVEDSGGRVLAAGKNLTALQDRLAPTVRRAVSRAARGVERRGIRAWDFGELPANFQHRQGDRDVVGYPALVDRGDSVDIEVLPTAEERDAATRLGVRRLLLLNTAAPWKRVLAVLSNTQKLALGHNPHGSVPALLDDCLSCAVDSLMGTAPVTDQASFEAVLATVRQGVPARVVEVVELVQPVLDRARQAELAVAALSPAMAAASQDMRAQLGGLVPAGFVTATGYDRLRHLDRYLRGILARCEKAPSDPRRDAERQAVVERVQQDVAALVASLRPLRRTGEDVAALRWMVEELRVSLFAQTLGTAHPVSQQRIARAIHAVAPASA